MITPEKQFMRVAIDEAVKAREAGDYAVGAVIIKDGTIIVQTSNRSKRDESPIAHAEALAIIAASKKLGHRHLQGCVLYTTNEPCPMCASLAVWAKLKGIVFGARMEDMRRFQLENGNHHFQWRTINITCEEILNKSNTETIELVKDFMREECMKLFHSGT